MKIRHLLLPLLALGAVSFAQAQLVVYTFDGVTDPVDNNAVVIPAAAVEASVTTGGITGAGDLGLYRIRNPNGAYDSSVLLTDNSTGDADAAAAFAAGGYFSFTLTPTVADLDLGSLDFLVAKGGATGVRRLEIRYAVDGSSTGTLQASTEVSAQRGGGTAGMDVYALDLSAVSALQNLGPANTVEFQFITATDGTDLTLEWDSISVSEVPAPTPGSLQLSAAAYSGSYDSGGITVSVERTGGSAGAVSVDYATADGTALAGTDYAARKGTLTWADGVGGSRSVLIPLLDDPASAGKAFSIGLSGESGAATLGSPASATVGISGPPPNIVLFFMDDMGINDIGAYAYPEANPYPGSGQAPITYSSAFDPLPPPNVAADLTPRIDSLATEGAKFSSFYAAVSVCTPSRAGLMTGSYATRVDMEEVIWNSSQTHGLNPSEVTIAERLKQAGYTTGIIGKWHLGLFGGSYGMDFNPRRHGFDMFLGTNSGVVNTTELYDGESIAAPITTATGGTITSPIDTVTERRYLLEAQTERSMAFIEDAHSNGQPFFLYFSTIAPHTPCWPHPDFINASGESQYYDVVAELDHRVGQILDQLDALGIAGNTLVIFTSDNGPWVSRYESNPSLRLDPENTVGSAYPFRGYKRGSNEGGPRVPFLARLPGRIPAGLIVDGMGSGIDLLPTLLGLAGGELPAATIDGVDIWPLLNGSTGTSPRTTFFYYEENDTSAVGVRKGDDKLLRSTDYDVRTGLFNLATDIQESTNLGSSATLDNLISAHNSAMVRRTRATSKSISIEIDSDTVTVPEGGTATFKVRLSAPANLTVTISRFAGDTDLAVQSGGTLSFTTGNYATWQTVTLAAAGDPDFVDSGATFRATASGLNLREIFAREADTTPLPLSAAEQWRQLWFGQTENTGDAADDFDFEPDGLINLLERAFGTNPTVGETALTRASGAPPVLSLVDAGGNPGNEYLALTYRRLAGGSGTTGEGYSADGLSYFVEQDADLINPWSTGGITVLSILDDTPEPGIQTVTVRSNTPLSPAERAFIRLKVEAAP